MGVSSEYMVGLVRVITVQFVNLIMCLYACVFGTNVCRYMCVRTSIYRCVCLCVCVGK